MNNSPVLWVNKTIPHVHKVERCIRLERRIEFLEARINRSHVDAWHDKGEMSAIRFALDCVYSVYPDLKQQVDEAEGKQIGWYESAVV